MRNKESVRKRMTILANAIEDVYGRRLSFFYSELRDVGEISFMPHPLISITINIDKHHASVTIKESECATQPSIIKSIRDFNGSSVLDICEFVEDRVKEMMVRFDESERISPVVKPVARGWLGTWMKRLGFIDWWEGTK